ncbi:uncharacterized protein LOC135368647 [Ornithodoros turicata]|uniref:uncharacterized protein LOC135368647 n=1 Tax=Ornithodoros turicata TaxID=34597 RepID=UPI003139A1ED
MLWKCHMAANLRTLKVPLNSVLCTPKVGNVRSHTGLLTLNSAPPACNFYATLTSTGSCTINCLARQRYRSFCPAVHTRATSSVCLPEFRQQTETTTHCAASSRHGVFQPELLESFCPLDIPEPRATEHAPFSFLDYEGSISDGARDASSTVPTTVLSGYLGAQPYQVYCFNAGYNDTKGTALSNYEKEVMRFADDTARQQATSGSPHPGRPSEEQLQKTFSVLADCLPKFFVQPHAYHLYHKDVIFQNNIRGVTTYGLTSYVQQLALVRVLGHLRYANVKLEVLKMTLHKEDGTIRIRWRITGVSGLRVLLMFWKFKIWQWKKMMNQEAEWTDGFSIMYLGADGLIYKHECDKIMPDEEPKELKTGNVALKLALMLGLTPQASGFGGAGSLGTISLASDTSEESGLA